MTPKTTTKNTKHTKILIGMTTELHFVKTKITKILIDMVEMKAPLNNKAKTDGKYLINCLLRFGFRNPLLR